MQKNKQAQAEARERAELCADIRLLEELNGLSVSPTLEDWTWQWLRDRKASLQAALPQEGEFDAKNHRSTLGEHKAR